MGLRYMFRVRASNDAGPGAWSSDVIYVPQPGPPCIRSAPELSSAEPGHVCVEWEAADSNGMEVLGYALEMAEAEQDGKGGEGKVDKFEPVEVYKLESNLRIHHVKKLAHNKRYLFRLTASNAIGDAGIECRRRARACVVRRCCGTAYAVALHMVVCSVRGVLVWDICECRDLCDGSAPRARALKLMRAHGTSTCMRSVLACAYAYNAPSPFPSLLP